MSFGLQPTAYRFRQGALGALEAPVRFMEVSPKLWSGPAPRLTFFARDYRLLGFLSCAGHRPAILLAGSDPKHFTPEPSLLAKGPGGRGRRLAASVRWGPGTPSGVELPGYWDDEDDGGENSVDGRAMRGGAGAAAGGVDADRGSVNGSGGRSPGVRAGAGGDESGAEAGRGARAVHRVLFAQSVVAPAFSLRT